MSAPLSPEQRETLDELVLSMIDALNYEQINYGGRFSTVTVDGSDLAALRAALVERACGTCAHFRPWFPFGASGGVRKDERGDCAHRNYAGRRNGQSPDDGCLKGWTARPSQAETTP